MVLTGLSVGLGIALRFYNLSFPGKPVFDEVYFPLFAKNYLHGKTFFDVHPPLGKFIIAIGLAIFGDDKIGWRIIPALFGVGLTLLMPMLYRRLFKENIGALVLAGFFALDGLFICYSRTGLMDGILFTAIFACVYLASKIGNSRVAGLWTAIALGSAVSIKWTALATIVPMIWYAWEAKRLKPFFLWLPLTGIIYFGVVVLGQVAIGTSNPVWAAWHWHKESFDYQASLTATHHYGSLWISWPVEWRTVLFLYDKQPDGTVQVMTTLANPLVLWGSTLTVLGTTLWFLWSGIQAIWLRTKGVREEIWMFRHPVFPLLLGYYSAWLPFAPVHRVMFFYHYMPAYGFALLLTAYWIGRLAQRSMKAAFVLCALAVLMAWYEMPFALGYPTLTRTQIDMRLINRNWVYY
jgi:dolichyl-phosphate-mannose-protein mannosyltransferase